MSQDGPRSVKISSDERLGWSSDRPRKEGSSPRPANIAVRGRTLAPSKQLRYMPGSLVIVATADPAGAERFIGRVLEDKAALMSPAKVRRLLEGRVAAEQLEEQAAAVLDAAVAKRLNAGDAVVLIMEGFDSAARERYVRVAAALRRPRHLVLLEGEAGEDRDAMDDLRRALLAEELGDQGFHTGIRLGGASASGVSRLVFQAPPRSD